MEKNEILKKALDNIDEDEYYNTCINGRVCPKCGKDLYEARDSCTKNNNFTTIHECRCGFRHSFEI